MVARVRRVRRPAHRVAGSSPERVTRTWTRRPRAVAIKGLSGVPYQVYVCRGPYCGKQCGSATLEGEIRRLVLAEGLSDQVTVQTQACFGRCSRGPNLLVRPRRTGPAPLFAESLPLVGRGVGFYNVVQPSELERIVREHLVGGTPCRDLMNRDPHVPGRPPGLPELP